MARATSTTNTRKPQPACPAPGAGFFLLPSEADARLVRLADQVRALYAEIERIDAEPETPEALLTKTLKRKWALLDRAAGLPATSTEALLAKAAMITNILPELAGVHGCDTLTELGESLARDLARRAGA